MTSKNLSFTAVLAALFLAGCSMEPKGSVRIVSIKPEPVTVLRVGQKVDMEAVVEYTMDGKRGQVNLVVQTKEGEPLNETAQAVELTQSSGTVTLRRSFEIPETAELHAFVPLYAGAKARKTGIVDSRTYNIAPKK